jgi:predicted ATPase
VLLRDEGKASVTVGPWPDTLTANLPLSLASFVGRERELDEIATLVREHRLLTLTGSGGVGKTQTALQVATALGDSSAAWFVGLAPISDPSLIPAAIASALRVQDVPTRPLLETLLEHLKNKTLLLILDNCEHVVVQAAMVADALLANCPRVAILATSREPLRARDEQVYRIPSLSASDSVTLFADRARAVDHRFALTDDSAPAVAELCGSLDGIPLAIELAAARVDSLSIAALTERLEARFRVLAGGGRTALPRQQTMRATIDWSFDLLSAAEQRVFERLSVFAGGCMLAGAQAVCTGEDVATADVVDVISSLVDKSMVVAEFDGLEPRYGLLESFRQYAYEKLASRGEAAVVAHRHALACCETANRLMLAARYEPGSVHRRMLHDEFDNWRSALRWSLTERGDVLLGIELVGNLLMAWLASPAEGHHWITTAIGLVDERTPTKLVARLMATKATSACQHNDFETQLASSQEAYLLFRTIGDLSGTVWAQERVADALHHFGRFTESDAALREALAGVKVLGEHRLEAQIRQTLAGNRAGLGDITAARVYIAEAVLIYEQCGANGNAAHAISDLGAFEFCEGNVELALSSVTHALAVFRDIGYTIGIADNLVGVATCLVALGRYNEALEFAREALALACENQLTLTSALALEQVGTVAAFQPETARELNRLGYTQAARIIGFAEEHSKNRGHQRRGFELQERERCERALREALGGGTLARLTAEGAEMTLEQAIKEASEISFPI